MSDPLPDYIITCRHHLYID